MKLVVHWSGGKECCLALHKVIKQGHEVAYLLSYIYKEPYVFHSIPLMELQSKTLGIPHLKVKIKRSYEDILAALARLKREEGVEGFVTGDIVGAGCAQVHQTYYDAMCEQLGMKLIMPNENPSRDTYDVLAEEIAVGLRPLMNCINMDHFGEEWLGRVLDESAIKELKALADKQGIDVCSEDGRGFHTMVVDAPLFRERIAISKFQKKKFKEKAKHWKRNWLYMDIKEAFLMPKK
ncbi:MAG: diphthine--ammonia ligase [Candidatus Bathyarchaeota archaeon]|nr:diphthine--ammonia ligase [Candidatus Bathyarchaeota archaeon]